MCKFLWLYDIEIFKQESKNLLEYARLIIRMVKCKPLGVGAWVGGGFGWD